jgi:hypothetical protein
MRDFPANKNPLQHSWKVRSILQQPIVNSKLFIEDRK